MGSKQLITNKKILLENKLPFRNIQTDDSIIFNSPLDLPNQRVVRADCERTRGNERNIQESFVEYCEKFLTFYCKQNKIKYRQGLNEIAGPFVLIKSKVNISFSRLFNMFSLFIDKYLTNYFVEDEFFCLQLSLSLVNLLLQYHSPEMFNILRNSMLTSQIYATSWILTLFAK